MKLPYAEDVGHYWLTSRRSPDDWLAMARRIIVDELGGKVMAEAFGSADGQAAYLLNFQLGEECYRIVWPVLNTFTGREQAARIQAATFLYHDVKAKAMAAKVLGNRAAFFSYLQLPDGRNVTQAAMPELEQRFPKLLK